MNEGAISHLRLVTSNRPDSHFLFATYCEAKGVWHRTKLEGDRQRAMRAYNTWIVGSFPHDQQESLLLRSASNWGFN